VCTLKRFDTPVEMDRIDTPRNGLLRAPTRAHVIWLILLIITLVSISSPALAEKRVALVVGNSAYRSVPALPNSAADANAIGDALEHLGFQVVRAIDADYGMMRSKLDVFSTNLRGADVGLFYYAGHGLQVDRQNYLLPVDTDLGDESDLEWRTFAMDQILRGMRRAAPVNLVFMDACRDNPFATQLKNANVGRGLAEVQKGIGMLIVYATSPDQVALDGQGDHSPFTAALLGNISTAGLEVRQVLSRVRDKVVTETNGFQVPWDASSLTTDFFFVAPTAVEDTSKLPGDNAEEAIWQYVKDSDDPKDFERFLQKFPSGSRAETARKRLAELSASREAAEATVWDYIKDSSDPEELRRYLSKFPNSPNAAAARQRLSELEASQATAIGEESKRKADEAARLAAAAEEKRKADEAAQLAAAAEEKRKADEAAQLAAAAEKKRKADEAAQLAAAAEKKRKADEAAQLAAAAEEKRRAEEEATRLAEEKREAAQLAAAAAEKRRAEEEATRLGEEKRKADEAAQLAAAAEEKRSAEEEATRLAEEKRKADEAARLAFLELSAADRRAVQVGLRELGLYSGKLDGRFGQGTQKAIAAYQGSQGQEPTGILGTAEVDKLLRTADAAKVKQQADEPGSATQLAQRSTSPQGAAGPTATQEAILPAVTVSSIFGGWCSGNIRLDLTASSVLYTVSGDTLPEWPVRSYHAANGIVTLQFENITKGQRVTTEFGQFGRNGDTMIQIRGKEEGGSWVNYGRQFKRC
jgi:uncharacterized caspase-like protein/peptidoglycan hydrolase-like protein with peptidoglycan-binding domain